MFSLKKSTWLGLLLMVWPLLAMSQSPVLMVLGDSLSSAYGIEAKQSWVSLLQQRLKEKELDYSLVNLSVSGMTSSGGLHQYQQWLTEHRPALVILELGANDGLRGLSLKALEINLQLLIDLSVQAKTQVLLVGMQVPPNLGPVYTERFFEIYPRLAEKNTLAFVPFLLDKVAGETELIQRDSLHPNASAQSLILDNVWASLMPLL